jgi:hypothetical protein
LLTTKNNGYIKLASTRLAIYVQAMYDGEEGTTNFAFESVEDVYFDTITPIQFVELCDPLQKTDNIEGTNLPEALQQQTQ